MKVKFSYKYENIVYESNDKPLLVIPASSFATYSITIRNPNLFDLNIYLISENFRIFDVITKVNEREHVVDDANFGFPFYIMLFPDVNTSETPYEIIIYTETLYPV